MRVRFLKRHFADQKLVMIAALCFLLWLALKDRWRMSSGMRELFSKHFTMFVCSHVYFRFFQLQQPFSPEHSDVLVASFGRSGTLMTVQMLHQLRTGGDTSFDDIWTVGRFVIPVVGLKSTWLSQPQISEPRIFWTHGFPRQIPAIKKLIYIVRNPVDVLGSWFHFVPQIYQLQNDITLEEFYYNCFIKNCYYPSDTLWKHIVAFWSMPNVLWLHYEEVTKSKEALSLAVEKVANFTNISLNDNLRRLVVQRTSFEHVKANWRHFDGHRLLKAIARTINICQPDETLPRLHEDNLKPESRAVAGTSDGKKSVKVPEEIVRHIQKKWMELVYPVTGFRSYEEMLNANRMA